MNCITRPAKGAMSYHSIIILSNPRPPSLSLSHTHPVCVEVPLNCSTMLGIIASDGLWDVVTPNEVREGRKERARGVNRGVKGERGPIVCHRESRLAHSFTTCMRVLPSLTVLYSCPLRTGCRHRSIFNPHPGYTGMHRAHII